MAKPKEVFLRPKEYYEKFTIPEDNTYVFTLLPPDFKKQYEKYIKNPLEAIKIESGKITCGSYLDFEPGRDYQDEMWKSIKKAGIVIVNITGFNPSVMFELGVALTMKSAVILIAEKSLESNPKLPFNINTLGVVFYEPHNLNKLSNHLLSLVEKKISPRMPKIKNPDVMKLMNDVFGLRKDGKFDTALLLLEQMSEIEPKNWYIYKEWGITYRLNQTYNEAISKLTKALEFANTDRQKSEIYTELGVVYHRNNMENNALLAFEKAEIFDRDNADIYDKWAYLYYKLGKYQEAMNRMVLAVKLDDNKNYKWKLEYYAKKFSDKDFRMGLADFLKTKIESERSVLPKQISRLGEEPENLNLLNEIKTIYEELGEIEEAGKVEERIKRLRDKKEFEHNLGKTITLHQVQLHNMDFFSDITWRFQPGMNVLLGRNGFGKSYLLRFLTALLQKDHEEVSEFFAGNRKETFAQIIVEREKKQEIIYRNPVAFDKSIGRIPLLAIPDLRMVDKSGTVVYKAREEKEVDLGQYWSYHFLHQQPMEEFIRDFMYQLCITHMDKGKTFELPIFQLVREVVEILSGDTFEFHKIERIGRVDFKIHVITEGSQNPIPLQKASQGTLSVFSIFGLIYSYLESMFPGIPDKEIFNKPAIVIIDELDAHLHPSWQQQIVSLLRKYFPNIQFFVTAHSPLVVAGCKEGEVAVLRKEKDGFGVHVFEHDFIGYQVKELYEKVFEIEEKDETYLKYIAMTPFKKEIEEKIKRLEEKQNKKSLVEKEEKELRQLYDKIYYIEKANERFRQRREYSKTFIENKKLKARLRRLEFLSGEKKAHHFAPKP